MIRDSRASPLDLSLPDLCDTGVAGDDFAWSCHLDLLRREMAGDRYSQNEAGHLAVLLMLAGRADRACQVCIMLEDLAPCGAVPARGAPCAERRACLTDRFADSTPTEFDDDDTQTNLLAALVLSGRWTLARRCCERMVRLGHSGAARMQRGHLPFFSW